MSISLIQIILRKWLFIRCRKLAHITFGSRVILSWRRFIKAVFRILDISGELMGDLYKQGREIAFFLSSNKEGHLPNAPMVWGTQPYKGLIYFADMNSGLYAIRLVSIDAKKETD